MVKGFEQKKADSTKVSLLQDKIERDLLSLVKFQNFRSRLDQQLKEIKEELTRLEK